MGIRWADIAFEPDQALSKDTVDAWRWLIGDGDCQPFICSKLGDIFFESEDGRIGWLSCPAGFVEDVASDRLTFDQFCRNGGEKVDEWFGPSLISALIDAGKITGPGDCYQFIILPVFAECRYEPDNFAVVPCREIFIGLADIHKQIADLPDGQSVQLKIDD